MKISRRELMKLGMGAAAVTAAIPLRDLLAATPLMSRKIPSSGEQIPVVGIGGRDWEAETSAIRAELKEVLRQFPELGGRLIDTAMNYRNGASETLIGELSSELRNRVKLFLATKINVSGKQAGMAQIEQSFQRLRTDLVDLIQVHNIRDTDTQLANLHEVKQAGRLRYLGMTTSDERQYGEFEALMKKHSMDVVQVDYALDNRVADKRLLPLAKDRGMAVLINMPFGRGRLFSAVRTHQLPVWAKEIDCTTWAQIFLKYIVSHPAVTCVIPGTRRVAHLTDNLKAAQGTMPDADMRRRMEAFMDKII